jgi:hypothetical protein
MEAMGEQKPVGGNRRRGPSSSIQGSVPLETETDNNQEEEDAYA